MARNSGVITPEQSWRKSRSKSSNCTGYGLEFRRNCPGVCSPFFPISELLRASQKVHISNMLFPQSKRSSDFYYYMYLGHWPIVCEQFEPLVVIFCHLDGHLRISLSLFAIISLLFSPIFKCEWLRIFPGNSKNFDPLPAYVRSPQCIICVLSASTYMMPTHWYPAVSRRFTRYPPGRAACHRFLVIQCV
jgi:hypothetical protein